MLTVKLQGGLGNQLFQLAAAEHISKKTNKKFYLCHSNTPKTIHSDKNYFDSIFRSWTSFLMYNINSKIIRENSHMLPEDWVKRVSGYSNVILEGYFQNYQYVDPIYDEFTSRLSFDDNILLKYKDISESIFIHIRGGDYVNSKFHQVDLSKYYKKAFEEFKGEKFYVFTNDKKYSSLFLDGIDYQYIDEDELNTLYLMTKCKGCICSNSSFSWWGAYLNKKRKIIMPSKWYNDDNMYINGYYFPGVMKIDVY